jgi:hypothetical protein
MAVLTIAPASESEPSLANVSEIWTVQNWFEELRHLVPTNLRARSVRDPALVGLLLPCRVVFIYPAEGGLQTASGSIKKGSSHMTTIRALSEHAGRSMVSCAHARAEGEAHE